MASAPTHIVATAAIAAFFHRPRVPWHLWLTGAVLAVAPGLDVFAPRVGVAYRDLVAHRGLSHSLLTAAVISGLVVALFYRSGAGPLRAKGVWLFLFLAMASHGVLDALTKGGLGVAFFAPFSEKRYFFPDRPLAVSPLSIRPLFTSRGLAILINEMRWVWAPSVALAAVVLTFRSWRRPRRVTARPRPTAKPRPAPPVIPSAPKRTYAPPPPPPPPPPLPPPLSAPEPQATHASSPPSPGRHRRRLVFVIAVVAVIVAAGVFVAVQPVPPKPTAVEQPPAPVAPPRPLQVDAEGSYEPGYQFSVMGARFTRLTLLPEPSVTFARVGTRQETGCYSGLVRADSVYLVCDVDRVGILTIEGRFVSRFATTALDKPVLSALLTMRNVRGETVYRARDSFVWRAPE
jgi:inner membrane protein